MNINANIEIVERPTRMIERTKIACDACRKADSTKQLYIGKLVFFICDECDAGART